MIQITIFRWKKKSKRVNDSTRAANDILDYSTSRLYVDWENSLQISHTQKNQSSKPPVIVIGHGAYFGYLDRSIQSCASEWCSVVRSWSKHISIIVLLFNFQNKKSNHWNSRLHINRNTSITFMISPKYFIKKIWVFVFCKTKVLKKKNDIHTHQRKKVK